jgi:hypothetical protein
MFSEYFAVAAKFNQKKIHKLIFVNKNWPFNPFIKCSKFCDLPSTCEAKLVLMEELYVELKHEVEHEEIMQEQFLALV